MIAMLLALGLNGDGAIEARLPPHQVPRKQSQEQPAALVAEAAAALERGDSVSAVALLHRVLALDPKNLVARTYLGILADRAGDLPEAERQFAAAVAAAPDSPEARNNYGAILLKRGRRQFAAAQFEASLRLNRNQTGAMVNLAQIRFESGTPEGLRQARDLFRRAHALAPTAETARALLVISLRLHETQSAASDYAEYAKYLAAAPESVTAAGPRAELGRALLEAGFAREAAQELEASLRADPSNSQTVVSLAKAYQAQKELGRAQELLESFAGHEAPAASVFYMLGEIYDASGNPEKAIPAMRRAIELDPHSEAYRFRYAMLLTDTSAPQAAVIRLQEALAIFPNSSMLWFAMGIAQFQDHKYIEASRAFHRSTEINPKLSAAYAYLGMIAADQGNIPEAVGQYKKALSIDAHSAVSHYLMAEALEKDDPPDNEGAEEHLRLALGADPRFRQAHLALGKLLIETNRTEEGVRELENVVQGDPTLAAAYYQLGRGYVRLKRKKEAQAAMARFEELSSAQKKEAESQRMEIVRRLANVRF